MSTKNDYMLLFVGTNWYNELSYPEVKKLVDDAKAWFDGLIAQGKVKGGNGLARTGARVTGKTGRVISDGPYAETKEALGGFIVVEAANIEEAITIAKTNPTIPYGTTVEIRGSTYVCEDRLAKKYDNRFDISCDKDTECPPGVTGWATIKVYDIDRPQPEAMLTPAVLRKAPPPRPLPVLLGHYAHLRRPAIGLKDIARSTPKLASLAASASVLRGRG